ncbi:MAG: hypothetical protein QXQ40_01795 [Candidatus Aenigmatarchaeota archaeon]
MGLNDRTKQTPFSEQKRKDKVDAEKVLLPKKKSKCSSAMKEEY